MKEFLPIVRTAALLWIAVVVTLLLVEYRVNAKDAHERLSSMELSLRMRGIR